MHPRLDNQTPFAATILFLGGGNEAPLFAVALVQATYHLDEGKSLVLLRPQPSIDIAGQWHGDPAESSYRLEPQVAYGKLATDVVLIGHAIPEGGRPATELLVGLRVGALRKVALVSGDRQLVRGMAGLHITAPQPFERMPLTYERAFGGWDRRHADPARHVCERRNPVGVGYRDSRLPACEELRLPNIENPSRRYTGYGDTPPPVGFGFIGPDWLPRANLAGTYGATWDATRKPMLPADFDPRFFNAASPGLISEGYLQGDEEVVTLGLSPVPIPPFRLPGVPPPQCTFATHRAADVQRSTTLDTLVIDMDQRFVTLTWRCRLAMPRGPHQLSGLLVQASSGAAP
jgi:hypothetical protein